MRLVAKVLVLMWLGAAASCAVRPVSSVSPGSGQDGGADADAACGLPQPTCTSPLTHEQDVTCCTQATVCGVCYGDAISPTQCVEGEWRCGPGWSLFSACRSTWSPLQDAGASLPICDGGSAVDAQSSGCPTPDPTSSSNGMYCLSGHDHVCCGDIGYSLVCSEGAWSCPAGTVLFLECTAGCNDAGTAPD